jgi:hypothetical protein
VDSRESGRSVGEAEVMATITSSPLIVGEQTRGDGGARATDGPRNVGSSKHGAQGTRAQARAPITARGHAGVIIAGVMKCG